MADFSGATVIEGGLILTGVAGVASFQGDLVMVDGKIAAVGENAGSSVAPDARRVDGRKHLVVPGLINSHCHAADSLFRGLVENLPLEKWLETVWTAERAILTPQTTRLGAEIGFAELLLSGVTTVMDMFWYPDMVAEAAKNVGIRCATGGLFFDPPGMDKAGPEVRVRAAEEFFERFQNDPLIIPSINPHGTYTVGPDSLRAAWSLVEKQGSLFSTHAAETQQEQQTIMDRYGTTVIRHLDELGLLGPRTTLAHCVHLDDEEIELLAASGTHASHNPLSNLKLGSGIARIPDMLDAGVSITLGTDGPISGNDIDMWMAIRLAATLHKGAQQDAGAVTTDQVLDMVWRNGARSLGLEAQTGSLEVGKDGDVIMLALDRPHAVPLFDAATHLVYSAGRGDVQHVWVRGQHVVANGALTQFDLSAALDQVEELRPKIADSIR